ncbi:MAG: helix-turn-helix domain-containing protein [Puniceicoccaceae bacterium]
MYAYRKLRQIHHQAFPLNQLLTGNCCAIEEIVNPGYRYKIRNTTYFAPILTKSGCSDYIVDGVPCRLEPGSLFLLPPGISFSEQVPGPEPIHNIYLMLEGSLAREWAAQLEPDKPFLYLKRTQPTFVSALETVVRTLHSDALQHPWQVASDLCRLGQALQEALTQSQAGRAMASRLEQLIQQEPATHWSVARLAGSFGMSESSFAHTFREEAGQSPAAFVRRIRCRLARNRLEEGHSVTEVAEQLGFSNPYHFSRVFRTENGFPPSTLRRKIPAMHRAK